MTVERDLDVVITSDLKPSSVQCAVAAGANGVFGLIEETIFSNFSA